MKILSFFKQTQMWPFYVFFRILPKLKPQPKCLKLVKTIRNSGWNYSKLAETVRKSKIQIIYRSKILAKTEILAKMSKILAETVQNYPKLSSILALNFRLLDSFK